MIPRWHLRVIFTLFLNDPDHSPAITSERNDFSVCKHNLILLLIVIFVICKKEKKNEKKKHLLTHARKAPIHINVVPDKS